jgi:hypothetical protein
MLSSLLSNPLLQADKGLFLDAMQEATDRIIGKAEHLPLNIHGRPEGWVPRGGSSGVSSGGRGAVGITEVVTHHDMAGEHSLKARSESPAAGSRDGGGEEGAKKAWTYPPSVSVKIPRSGGRSISPNRRYGSSRRGQKEEIKKIPLHHLSPLNKTATGPKDKKEGLAEIRKLRMEKSRAVEEAKEHEIGNRRLLDAQEEDEMGFGGSAGVGGEEEDEEGEDSPLPSYTAPPQSSSMEGVLSPGQVAALQGCFNALSPSRDTCSAKDLAVAMYGSKKLRSSLGDLGVEKVCKVLRGIKGKDVTWGELLCFVINPEGEGFGIVNHVDPTVSLDLSAARLKGIGGF